MVGTACHHALKSGAGPDEIDVFIHSSVRSVFPFIRGFGIHEVEVCKANDRKSITIGGYFGAIIRDACEVMDHLFTKIAGDRIPVGRRIPTAGDAEIGRASCRERVWQYE